MVSFTAVDRLVCGGDVNDKNSHASQLTKTLKNISQKETAVNFLKEKEFKAILPDLKKVKFFSCLCSIYKSFQVNRVN